ncbi:MAG: 50S ribosomal protein L20 [Candidatus Colwellbacteria bacterium CG10_big_fil_rev_8_21_14_0_10_41_28]|uniref:Large ribosomal subunit protein bL20 n=1 Tax=Candidatus Colwellbacteria bacterium CG10_big_fil_rev_8_21_14_0_10_41_28 TaxID=1974539 RepID=A0A2H0VJU9_9BACT|nr:MAG: 50S ribosomal protein L20 [Candidatus Colwellbacteria bacterium CG10_big_fil_rev_8_21_14_0_10_41_28]
MPRVKRGTIANKRRRAILKQTKGYRWGRKSKEKLAKQALLKAWTYAYRDRRVKKREFRKLWQTKINAAARQHGISYSKLIPKLKAANIGLDRKSLADIAENDSKAFGKVLETAGISASDSSE